MSLAKYSFGRSALGALRALVRTSRAVLKGKRTGKEPRASIYSSVSEQLQQVLGPSVGKRSQPRFVVLVFIHYKRWYRESQGKSQSMQLDSVRNDLVMVLNYLRYQHGDKETMWHILTDFDLEYTDAAGKTQPLQRTNPTGEAILSALTEAGETGGSGLVYFGAHGEYGPSGTSVLTEIGDWTHYAVNAQGPAESKSSFILAIDGGRIYSEDIFSRLPEDVATDCVHTVALDACNGGGFAKAARGLRRRYDGKLRTSRPSSPEVPARAASAEQAFSKQLVIISAAREGELTRSVRPSQDPGEHGRLTWYLIDWLQRYPYSTAQTVAARLRHRLVVEAPENEQQHPEIWARRSLTDSFELLPGLLRQSLDESRAVGRLGPFTISWSRPPRPASGRMR